MFAKAIALQLQPLLSKLVHHTQTGFMSDRNIVENIFNFWEASAFAKHSKQNLAVILLDFEKVYDRVYQGFLEEMLLRSGFSDTWVKWIVALY